MFLWLLFLLCSIKGTFLLWCIPKVAQWASHKEIRWRKVANKKPTELETYGLWKQCAAVSTQQGSMRLPPHRKWSMPLMFWKMPAIQGWDSTSACLPPTILKFLLMLLWPHTGPVKRKNFVQMFLQINSNLVLLKIKLKNQTPVVLKLILLTTLLYVARGFLNGISPFGVTPGSVPSIWVSNR